MCHGAPQSARTSVPTAAITLLHPHTCCSADKLVTMKNSVWESFRIMLAWRIYIHGLIWWSVILVIISRQRHTPQVRSARRQAISRHFRGKYEVVLWWNGQYFAEFFVSVMMMMKIITTSDESCCWKIPRPRRGDRSSRFCCLRPSSMILLPAFQHLQSL